MRKVAAWALFAMLSTGSHALERVQLLGSAGMAADPVPPINMRTCRQGS